MPYICYIESDIQKYFDVTFLEVRIFAMRGTTPLITIFLWNYITEVHRLIDSIARELFNSC